MMQRKNNDENTALQNNSMEKIPSSLFWSAPLLKNSISSVPKEEITTYVPLHERYPSVKMVDSLGNEFWEVTMLEEEIVKIMEHPTEIIVVDTLQHFS